MVFHGSFQIGVSCRVFLTSVTGSFYFLQCYREGFQTGVAVRVFPTDVTRFYLNGVTGRVFIIGVTGRSFLIGVTG